MQIDGRRKFKSRGINDSGFPVIALTKGAFAIVDESDAEFLTQWSWHISSGGYATRTIRVCRRKCVLRMHHVVLSRNSISIPEGLVVDHINGNKLDNRIENLRVASRFLNAHNVQSLNGVETDGSQFVAKAMVRGHRLTIGRFETRDQAAAAYRGFKLAVVLYEDDAIKNKPAAA